eukprot:g1875.t1
MSAFAELNKKPKKAKKDKKDKKAKKDKKKKKKKDLLSKLAAIEIASDDDEDGAAAAGDAAAATFAFGGDAAADVKEESPSLIPESATARKKRIRAEKKAKRAAKERARIEAEEAEAEAEAERSKAPAAPESASNSGDSDGGGESKSEKVEEKKKKNKKKKKLTRKELKKLKREQERALEDAALAERSKFPFTVSHCVHAITDPEAWKRSPDINITEFTIAGSGAKGTQLFENAALKIIAGRKYGLIGPNGMGKSTLLRLINMKRLKIPPCIDLLMVEQEIEGSETLAIDAVLAADKKRARLLKREAELITKLEDAAEDDEGEDNTQYNKWVDELEEVTEALTDHGAAAAEPRARSILAGLGFTVEMQDRPTFKFSGGWRMRISLARALFMEPTLLILDEPTNHLDLNAVLWLDAYLQNWKGTLIVVSHDQDFLNNVVTDIIHLQDRKLLYYRGNYERFKVVSEQAFKDRVKAYEKQQKQLAAAKRKNTKGKKGDAAKSVIKKTREKGARTAKKAAKQKGGMDAAGEAKIGELLTRPKEYRVKVAFPAPTELSPPIIEVKDVSFRYADNLPLLFKGVEFGIDMDSRVSMVGPNGVGKSTLLSLIMNELNPTEGMSPVQFLQSVEPEMPYQKIRNHLGRFGLGGHAHEIKISQCSGGQKARVVLASLALEAPHILVLDEPTNHLDIETIDALAEGLRNFEGGVVLVSHDARLICEAGCELWVVDNKTVTRFDGDFEDYRDQLLDEIEASAEAAKAEVEAKLEARAKEREAKLLAAKKRREERAKQAQ